MFPNLSDTQILGISVLVPLLGLYLMALCNSAKAKAFNKGYKRGRASVRYTEIVK